MRPDESPVHFNGVFLSPSLFLDQMGTVKPLGQNPVNLKE